MTNAVEQEWHGKPVRPGLKDVYMKEVPNCSFCLDEALVDGTITTGQWAFMCLDHYRQYGIGLGVGIGQRLHLQ